jgi:hypothetical protein
MPTPLIQVSENFDGDWISVINITTDQVLFQGHSLRSGDLVSILEELGFKVQKTFLDV